MRSKIMLGIVASLLCSSAIAVTDETCIARYDKSIELQDTLTDDNILISAHYSHFRVAQENYKEALKELDDLKVKLSKLDPKSKEYGIHTHQLKNIVSIIEQWDNIRVEKIESMHNALYTHALRVERLKRLRNALASCKNTKFDKDAVAKECATRKGSKWCQGRF